MKNRSVTFVVSGGLILALAFVNVQAAVKSDSDNDLTSVWLKESPPMFYLGTDFSQVPIEAADLSYLSNLTFKYYGESNLYYGVGPSSQCVFGDGGTCMSTSPLGSPYYNNRNEIHFNPFFSGINNPFDPDDIGLTLSRVKRPSRSAEDGTFIDRTRIESDVFINPRWKWQSEKSPGCRSDAFLFEATFLHEMGHALGLEHNGNSLSIMYESQRKGECSYEILDEDLKALRNLYGPLDPVQVSISHPRSGMRLYAGGNVDLRVANASKYAHDIEWKVEGGQVLGEGRELKKVPIESLGVGTQSLVATAVDSVGNRLGSDSVQVEVINSANTSLAWKPLPCIRKFGTNKCLLQMELTQRTSWCMSSFEAGHYRYEAWLYNAQNKNQTWDVGMPRSIDWSIHGENCEEGTEYTLGFYRWFDWEADFLNLVQVVHALDSRYVPDRVRWIGKYGSRVDFVDPSLREIDIPNSCAIESGESACGVEVNWSGLYFAPGSALYYRADGGSWQKVAEMGFQQGTVVTDKVVGMSGGEFAVFQYGSDVVQQDIQVNGKPPPRSYMYGYDDPRVLVNAPAGMMAGPFSVTAEPAAQPPTISIDSPADGARISEGEMLTLRLSGNVDSGAAFRSVEVFFNGTRRHSVPRPTTIRDFNLPAGQYRIVARASDTNGLTSESNAVDLTVGAAPSGSLSTNSPCTIPNGGVRCSVNLTVRKSSTPVSCIWLTNPSRLYACSGTSYWTKTFPYTYASARTLELRAHDGTPTSTDASRLGGRLLDTETIYGVQADEPSVSGSISGSTTCSLPGDQSPTRCTVRLTARKSGAPVGCLWLANPTKLFSCAGSDSWVADYDWTTRTGRDIELRAHSRYPSNTDAARRAGTLLDETRVRAQ